MKKSFFFFVILIFCFFQASEIFAADASLFLEPASGSYRVKENFSIKIRVNSDGTTINAAKASISFPVDLIEIQSLSKSNSIFQLWPEEPAFSNSNGIINFAGGVPSPGFNGIGTIATINFKVKKEGEANVNISEGQVLAADGRGTDILSYFKGGTYIFYPAVEIPPAEITPPEVPEEKLPAQPALLAPEILVYPRYYTAGEELFYAEGKASPDSTVIIFLNRGENVIKTWEILSDPNGNWIFSTDELFKTGDYILSAKSRDSKGNFSSFSIGYRVKIKLAGFCIGPWIMLYSTFSIILIILILLIFLFLFFIILSKNKKAKEKLKKETKEAKESLEKTFIEIGKELAKKIEYFDSKPGLNAEERKLRDEIFYILKNSEDLISKEIEDIEKELE